MTESVSTMLTDHCLRVDESQVPVSFEEILERSGDLETIPHPGIAVRERQPRIGATAAWIVAATLAIAAVTVVVGGWRPSDTVPDAPPPVGSPTTIAQDPSMLRPVGPLGGGRYLLAVNGSVGDIGVFATVPDGWLGGRWNVHKARGEDLLVGISVWEVDQVYGHPCDWTGTLFDPGPTVDDLATALSGIPLRAATQPVDAALSGFAGKGLEWSVPEDIDFADCDAASADDPYDAYPAGQTYLMSWSTPTGGDNFEHGPGQLDELWILNVDGTRIVIDVWHTPLASAEDINQLEEVIRSLEVLAP